MNGVASLPSAREMVKEITSPELKEPWSSTWLIWATLALAVPALTLKDTPASIAWSRRVEGELGSVLAWRNAPVPVPMAWAAFRAVISCCTACC